MVKKVVFLTLSLLLFLALADWTALAHSAPSSIKTEDFTSSRVCRKCHRAIFDDWQKSMHAFSFENEIFKAMFSNAYTQTQGEAGQLCLKCHAPTTYLNSDYGFEKTVTREGVTCDFCHTVKTVEHNGSDTQINNDLGVVKKGPRKGVSSPAHQVEYSQLHQESLFCSSCHEFTNKNGVKVRSTYSEWLESPYPKEGKQCQSCHMPRVGGMVVAQRISNGEKDKISDHTLNRTADVLRSSVGLEIKEIQRKANNLEVKVNVSNIGAGHMVPTGSPLKKLVLKVEARTNDNRVLTKDLVYQRILIGEDRKNIETEDDIILKAQKVVMDNRLVPLETREEEFSFAINKDVPAYVTAMLTYHYRPIAFYPTEIRVELARAQRFSKGD